MAGGRSRRHISAYGGTPTAAPDAHVEQLRYVLGSNLKGLWVLDPTLTENTYVGIRQSVAYDFSLNGNHATQSVDADRPRNDGDINGHACALFQLATIEWLTLPGIVLGTNRTIFGLTKMTSAVAVAIQTVLTLNDGSDTDMTNWIKVPAGVADWDAQSMRTHSVANGVGRRGVLPTLSTNPQIDIWTHTGTDPTAGYTLRSARASVTLSASDSMGGAVDIATPGAIGAVASAPERGFGGAIMFIGVMDSVATAAQVAAIEDFSLNKYGV